MPTSLSDIFAAHAAPGTGAMLDPTDLAGLMDAVVHPSACGLNRVDYARLAGDLAPRLAECVRDLERVDPASLDRNAQFAYWANLYNVAVLQVVAAHFPVASIRDIALGGDVVASLIGGPWKAKLVRVREVALSLDDIENRILRKLFPDPRLHYAINCGSVGCPNLPQQPFVAATLDADLDAAARAFINSPRGVRTERGGLVLSSIFKWYVKDFGGSERAVLDHLRHYATGDLAAALEAGTTVARYDYDWRLNDAP